MHWIDPKYLEELRAKIGRLTEERDALKLELIAAKPLCSRRELQAERDRFEAGLRFIVQGGPAHSGVWCAAQARGYLDDLDFDQWPETGTPPANQQAEKP